MMKQNLNPTTVTLNDSPYNYQPWYSSKSFEALSSLSHLTELLKGPVPTLTETQQKDMIQYQLRNAISNTLSIYVHTMGVESAIHDDTDIIMRFGFNGLLNRSISYELQYTHPTDGRNPVRSFCDGNPDSQRKNVPDNNRDLDDFCKEVILEDILREFSGFVLLYRQMCRPESGTASDGSASEDDADPDGVNDNDGLDRKARPPNK